MSLVRGTRPLSASEHIWIYFAACKDDEDDEEEEEAGHDEADHPAMIGNILGHLGNSEQFVLV